VGAREGGGEGGREGRWAGWEECLDNRRSVRTGTGRRGRGRAGPERAEDPSRRVAARARRSAGDGDAGRRSRGIWRRCRRRQRRRWDGEGEDEEELLPRSQHECSRLSFAGKVRWRAVRGRFRLVGNERDGRRATVGDAGTVAWAVVVSLVRNRAPLSSSTSKK
jgi:hypothetical protein